MSWKKSTLIALPLLALSACSFGVREDYDTIGSIRKSYTLGWKEGPRDSEYRPYRQQVYQEPRPADCMPQQQEAPASPRESWAPPAWVK